MGGHNFDMWPPGAIGVRLFFVLSGYVITAALWRARFDAATVGAEPWAIVRPFYLRRALRILPLAYVALAIAWVFGLGSGRAILAWYVPYLANFRVGLLHEPALAHFWSLAVEEQFYLFWPCLLLLTPPRNTPRVLALIIVVAAATRGLAIALRHDLGIAAMMLPTRADAFAAGALLALCNLSGRCIGICATIAVAGLLAIGPHAHDPIRATLSESCAVVLSAGAIWLAANRPARPLCIRPLVWLGTISYGLYLWHPLIGAIVPGLPPPGWTRFGALTAASILIAAASWYGLGRPLQRLKQCWPYPATSPDEHVSGFATTAAASTWEIERHSRRHPF